MREYVIRIDGQYWCGESDEVFGDIGSSGFFAMRPEGNKVYGVKLSPCVGEARRVLDPASTIKNILLKVRNFDSIEVKKLAGT
ncbi:MAG: hypothetical protein ACYC0N_00665 [Carboxydocellales bacterium]